MEDKEEIQINFPGQILEYVGTQEKILKLFKYIKELQRRINLLKTSCDEGQEIICDYAKENKKLKEENKKLNNKIHDITETLNETYNNRTELRNENKRLKEENKILKGKENEKIVEQIR